VVSGKELVFRRPGEESDGEDWEEDGDNEDELGHNPASGDEQEHISTPSVPVAKAPVIMIHEDD
jgi:hypothetical protein